MRNEAETLKAIEEMRDVSQIASVFYVFPHKSASEQESISTVTSVVHHAFIDGFSAALLLQKVRQIIAGQSGGPSLPFCQFSPELQKLRRSLVKRRQCVLDEIFSGLSYGATLVLPQNDDPFGHLASVDSAILTPRIACVLHPELYARLCNVS